MTPEKEKELREKLEKEMPDGAYTFQYGNWFSMTGKQGAIDFQVELHKEAEKYLKDGNREEGFG